MDVGYSWDSDKCLKCGRPKQHKGFYDCPYVREITKNMIKRIKR